MATRQQEKEARRRARLLAEDGHRAEAEELTSKTVVHSLGAAPMVFLAEREREVREGWRNALRHFRRDCTPWVVFDREGRVASLNPEHVVMIVDMTGPSE